MKPAPFSSRRPLALGYAALAVLGAGLFGWGALASIAGAVIAAGQVETETRDHVVEHVDGGAVETVAVRDGDRVEAGEVLMRLDRGALGAERAMLAAEHSELVARRNRLEAEFRDAPGIAWDEGLLRQAGADATVRDIVEGQQRLFEARRRSRAGVSAQLAERINQMEQQVAGLDAQARALERERRHLGEELEVQRQLFEKKLTTLASLAAREREAARLAGRAGAVEAGIAEARGRIAELELQVLQVDTRRVEEAEGEAREVRARENQVAERLAAVERRLDGMEVRAPVAGEVSGMRVFAPGEVVNPGEPILRIVPGDAKLVVLAQLDPIHVDQVHAGQEAVLRFSSFPARNTPEFEGRVTRVGADAERDPQTGLAWYEVELALGPAIEGEGVFDADGWLGALEGMVAPLLPGLAAGWFGDPPGERAVPDAGDAAETAADLGLVLTPGMPVEVYMRTDLRAPLDYLVKPLTDQFLRALREE